MSSDRSDWTAAVLRKASESAEVLPGIPKVHLHHPVLSFEVGEDFLVPFRQAAAGEAERPFFLVVEGAIPNERIKFDGYWAAFGTDRESGQPITTCEWIDRLAPHAWGVVAAETCATYGGIHAMEGNPTGAMGLLDYLGHSWRASRSNLPIVCVPGCPTQPDSLMETLLYLLYQAAGQAPSIPLDEAHRHSWLFGQTVHEGCDRGGYYEQGDFAARFDSQKCIVKLGCWGPVVLCNVAKRGWMGGIGGCPNVGGVRIGCTMPAQWSNTLERDRARTYFQAYSAAAALYFVERALEEVHGGRLDTCTEYEVPDEAIGCGFHEAVRGALSHHLVIAEFFDVLRRRARSRGGEGTGETGRA